MELISRSLKRQSIYKVDKKYLEKYCFIMDWEEGYVAHVKGVKILTEGVSLDTIAKEICEEKGFPYDRRKVSLKPMCGCTWNEDTETYQGEVYYLELTILEG